MTSLLQLAGRILMSIIFIGAGLGKLADTAGSMGYIASGGLPMPEVALWVAIVVEIGAGVALLAGLFTRASGAVLAAWCIVTAVLFHANLADHNMMIQFLKNLAMAGGLLYVGAFGGGAYSLDAILFRQRMGGRVVA